MLLDITTLPRRTVVDGVFLAGESVVVLDAPAEVIEDAVDVTVVDGVDLIVEVVEGVVTLVELGDGAGSTYPTPTPISGGTY